MDHKATILQLLADGHQIAGQAQPIENVREHERLMRRADGYFVAAAALLTVFPEFHNELIEHPQFVAARKYQRLYRF